MAACSARAVAPRRHASRLLLLLFLLLVLVACSCCCCRCRWPPPPRPRLESARAKLFNCRRKVESPRAALPRRPSSGELPFGTLTRELRVVGRRRRAGDGFEAAKKKKRLARIAAACLDSARKSFGRGCALSGHTPQLALAGRSDEDAICDRRERRRVPEPARKPQKDFWAMSWQARAVALASRQPRLSCEPSSDRRPRHSKGDLLKLRSSPVSVSIQLRADGRRRGRAERGRCVSLASLEQERS